MFLKSICLFSINQSFEVCLCIFEVCPSFEIYLSIFERELRVCE